MPVPDLGALWTGFTGVGISVKGGRISVHVDAVRRRWGRRSGEPFWGSTRATWSQKLLVASLLLVVLASNLIAMASTLVASCSV